MRNLRNNHGAMPLWAKILLAVVALGIVGTIALIIVGVMFVKNSFMTTEADVSKLAGEIITIQEPLPAGFKWVVGMKLGPMQLVSAKAPDSQTVSIIRVPGGKKNAKELLAESEASSKSHIVNVDQRGTETIAGKQMEYEVGTMEKEGKRVKGFIGCLVDKEADRSTIIVGAQENGDYNLPQTQQFLKAIQKI